MVLPSDSYARITPRYTGAAVPLGAANVFTCVVPDGTDPDDVLVPFTGAFEDVVALMTTAIAVTSILIKIGPDGTGPSAEFAVNLPGASASNAVSPNTSVLVRKNTNRGGRSGRGRFYLPGLREDVVDSGGQIASGTVTSLQSAVDDFYADMIAGGMPLVLEHGPLPPVVGADFLTSLTVAPKVATQRRRLRR